MRWWVVIGLVGCADPVERVMGLDGDPAAGAEVFAAHCAECHGPDGAGTAEGPDLRDDDDLPEELAHKVLYGWGAMPPFEDLLTAQEVADVVAWVDQHVEGSAP